MNISKVKRYLGLVASQDAAAVAERLLLTSDIHTSGLDGIVPKKGTEIVVIAGDIMGAGMDSDESGERWIRNVFNKWAEGLADRGIDIVMTAGNHDRYLFRRWKAGRSIDWAKNVHYLIDRAETVKGIKFYGTPWCENDRAGRFELDRGEIAKKFASIPVGLDILVSHTPPSVPGEDIDLTTRHEIPVHCGSMDLTDALLAKKPKICVCGHVHDGSRKPLLVGQTMVLNVARVGDDRGKESYKPQRIEFTK